MLAGASVSISTGVGGPVRGGRRRRVTYEEYSPYGSTAWWAEKSGIQVSRKRYRYTGMEKDEETGLSYHSARYYATWLGRWCSADPIGLGDGGNQYAYVHAHPTASADRSGKSTSILLAAGKALWDWYWSEPEPEDASSYDEYRELAAAANKPVLPRSEWLSERLAGWVPEPIGGSLSAEGGPNYSTDFAQRDAFGAPWASVSDSRLRQIGQEANSVRLAAAEGGLFGAIGALHSLRFAGAGMMADQALMAFGAAYALRTAYSFERSGHEISRGAALEPETVKGPLSGELASKEALQAERTKLVQLLHKRELGLDPDIGGRFRPTEGALGFDIEAAVGRRLTRSTTVGDWVDTAGKTYDAVGPVPSQYFDAGSFNAQITGHLQKQGLSRVVLDLRGLSKAQVASVDTYVSGLSNAEQAKLMIFR